jgi:CubicO group peptidase (beta-lactamase class C family)
VRQAIEAGQLDADAPVQRYLPWFRVADAEASSRITLRHLLNQTSGLSRADGIAPLLQGSRASIEELARGMSAISLNRAVGERFEYSNLNYVLLGAVVQAVTGQSWDALVHERVLRPLATTHSHTDHDSARRDGMTALHRMWFGMPVRSRRSCCRARADRQPGGQRERHGALPADAAGRRRRTRGAGSSPQGVSKCSRRSPPARATLLSAEFDFRYGEGWFVGPFGAAADARWHLGNLASFAAWMVLLPESKQAVVVLVNANSELPFGDVNAVMSRLPVGVVNLLRGQAAPPGPSLRDAYQPFNAIIAAWRR